MSVYVVYIVRCADGTYYTGIAKDLSKRLHEHNHDPKGAKYTKARRPVVVVYQEGALNRSMAQQREAVIKKMSRTEKELLFQRS